MADQAKNVSMQTRYPPVKGSAEALPEGLAAPVWNRLVSWVVLIPLLYFAGNGNPLPTGMDSTVSASGTGSSHKLVVGLVCMLCSLLIFSRLPSVFAVSQQVKLLVALPLLALLSSAWSQDPHQTMVSGSILLVFTIFALYVGSSFEARGQFELLMLMAGIALPLSIALALFLPDLGAPGHLWRGIFSHKQNCAAVATLLLVTALHWQASGTCQRIFRVSCAAMCCVMIVMSQSRIGWALALVALCLSASLWLLQKLRAADALFATLLVAAVLSVVAYVVYSNAAVLLPAVGKDSTLSQRTIIWAGAWTTIAQNPLLGYGYGAFWTGLQGASLNLVLIADWALQQAQDGYLDLWLQVGVGGVILTALITAQAVWNGIRCFRGSGQDSYVRWCLVVIACALIWNIGESSLGMIHLVWFIFLLACIGLQQTAQAMRAGPVLDTDEHSLLPLQEVMLREGNVQLIGSLPNPGQALVPKGDNEHF
jgi:exopolysaccharide production protein ExoQ